jgi:FkbM family methyltransferase
VLQRTIDLTRKAWLYLIKSLERPQELPWLMRHVLLNKVHLGEILKLRRQKDWLRTAGIQTVIDIGANTGQFASAIRAVLPEARIYAFEPLQVCFPRLLKRMHGHGRFEAFCTALGDRSGEVRFWKSEFLESSSILEMGRLHKEAFPWTSSNTSITVPIQRLDEYIGRMDLSPKVLLKIDVQGYEKQVLEGGLETIKAVDYLILEASMVPLYEGESSFEQIYDLLRSLGFTYSGNVDQMLSPLDQSILQIDALFRRSR